LKGWTLQKEKKMVKEFKEKKFRGKVCRFCVERTDTLDYKEINLLRRYLTDRGKIISSRTTGTCAYHQRKLTQVIKRARHLALLPFITI